MIRRGMPEIRQLHFDHNNDFLYVKQDKLTGQDTIQTITNVIKTKDLRSQVINIQTFLRWVTGICSERTRLATATNGFCI